MNPKYIMITHWENHWDNIKNTKYSINMLKDGLTINNLSENAETLFIKLKEENKQPVKAWLGKVSNFRIEKNEIHFSVDIEKEIALDQIPKDYLNKRPGWYFADISSISTNGQFYAYDYLLLFPPFIYLIQRTQDWYDFEYYAYVLLKLLGINNTFRFVSDKQKGIADGFFKIGNLAVIYDTSLDKNFMERKEIQIFNYINQLSEAKFSIPDKKIDIPIHNCNKEVWIITRGTTRTIKRSGEITIKEISINSLIRIYKERLETDLLENDLAEELRNIS